MFSPDKINELSKIIGQLFHLNGEPVKTHTAKPVCPPITPQRALIILGLLTGTLDVNCISLSSDQTVQITLEGSLKRKTRLEKIMDEIGSLPFDEVVRAILKRL